MKLKHKKALQIEAKQKHIDDLKAAKARRRGEPVLERVDPNKNEKPTILIVCEGRNTEPSYFKKFKLTSAKIIALGNGRNTISLIEQAIEINEKNNYEQVWCVFDKDDFDANDFNNAVLMAEARNFHVAYSNQSFEYWLILHFEDHQGGPLARNRYESILNKYINIFGSSYEAKGSKLVTEDIFDILCNTDEQTNQPRIHLAIQRAKRNYINLAKGNPAKEESSTTVFKLVEEILKFIN